MHLKVPFSKPQQVRPLGELVPHDSMLWLFIKFLFPARGGRAGNEVWCCGHNAKPGALPQGEEKGNRK